MLFKVSAHIMQHDQMHEAADKEQMRLSVVAGMT